MSLPSIVKAPQGYSVPPSSRTALVHNPISLAVSLSVTLALVIVGTLFVGKEVAFLSIMPFVIAILALSGRQTVAAISLYFGYLAMEGMYKYLSGFSPAIYVIGPLLLVGILVGWRLTLHLLGDLRPTAVPLAALFAAFAGWGLVQILNPHGTGPLGGLATLFLFYVGPIMLYFVGYNVTKSSNQVLQFCYVLIGVCTIVSAFAVLQFIMGRPWTDAHLPGYSSITQGDWFAVDSNGTGGVGSFRPASTTSIGGGGAVWSQLGMVLSIGLMFSPRIAFRQKVCLAVCLFVNVIGLLVCGVRLLLLTGVFDIFLFVIILARNPRDLGRSVGLLLLAGIVATLGFLGAQALSGGILSQRYADTLKNPFAKYQHDRGDNLQVFKDNILSYPLGTGYQQAMGRTDLGAAGSSSDPALRNRNGETEFGAIGDDMGVPGIVLLFSCMIGVFGQGWRAFRRLQDQHLRVLAAMLISSLAGYFVCCFGGPAMQEANFFWLAGAFLAVLPAIEKREAKQTG